MTSSPRSNGRSARDADSADSAAPADSVDSVDLPDGGDEGADGGDQGTDGLSLDWHRRVVGRSLRTATQRSIDRGQALIRAAGVVLERSGGDDITVQDVADEAGQSLRTLYQYFASKDDLLLAVFEESMRTYAQLIRKAIAGLDDPLERLAGAVVAATAMSQYSDIGLDRGLARLRLRLADSSPDLVGRSQAAVSSLVRELVADAAEAGQVEVADPDGAVFMLMSLNAAYITSERLGNDSGVAAPDAADVVLFCLRGMGADLDRAALDDLTRRLDLPRTTSKGKPVAKRPRAAKRPTSK
ncbi:MAG: TetR/AcrR family transcriptional regulator [Acidimicrobiales bacterium]|nr:TetR/AcrR family transcriptional regulator [Acidimicrobiales bacterium]